MITPENNPSWIYNDHWTAQTFCGLSTDEKPTVNIVNGSVFIEMNTSKVYFFDEENTSWLEWGAESNAASTLSMTRPSLTLGSTLSPDVEEAVPEVTEEEMPEEADTTEDGE